MNKFYLTPEALNDLDQIWQYIAKDSFYSANKFEDELISAINKLSEFPYIGHKRQDLTKENVRFFIFKTYLIIYQPEENPIRVIRILSSYRDLFNIL